MKILQRKDGIYYTSIMHHGKRKQIYSKSKKELKQKIIDYQYSINQNKVTDDKNLTVAAWSQIWLKTYKKDVAQATYNMYKSAINLYFPFPNKLFSMLPKNESGLLFKIRNGQMLSSTAFKRKIDFTNKYLESKIDKYEKFSAHQLRHTYACILHKADVGLKEAQYFMGHKDIKVLLNIYTHLDDEDKQNSINKLNNFL